MKPNRKVLTGGALALLAVLLVAAILISNTLLRGARLDLTQNQLFSLTQGTKNILSGIDEPLHLYLFFSDKGTRDLPQLRAYAQRVREMIEEMAANSGGKLKLEVIDPQPFSEDEDRATTYGLQPVPGGQGGENIFLGLAGTNSTEGKAVIPFLAPDKEAFLEYDIAKLIQELRTTKKPRVAIVSGLPTIPGLDPMLRSMAEPWAIGQQLQQLIDVRELSASSLKKIDPEINVLVVVHPKELSDDAQYAIDQFVVRGGHLLVFVDPNAETDRTGADPNDPRSAMLVDKSSDLPKLFKAWGVQYDPHKVVLDRAHALSVTVGPGTQPVRAATILGFNKRDLNSEDVTTSSLSRLNLSTVGSFQLIGDSKNKLIPLVQTGTDAMVVPVERVKFLSDPSQLMVGYQPDSERHVIAGRLEGKFVSAFPDRTDPGHLSESKENGVIILVADTDLLNNQIWVRTQSVLGRQVMNAFASNGDFFINTVDNLTGSSDLISIRGRAVSHRPFTRVEDMKRAAEDSFRGKERNLKQELSATERKLAQVQSAKGAQSGPILSAEQQTELASFLQKKVEIRKELRQIRRGLDEQIDALGMRLKLINIGLIPVLVTLAALAFAWWRRRPRAAS